MQKKKIFLVAVTILGFIALVGYLSKDSIYEAMLYNPKTNYAEILKTASTYDNSDTSPIKFTYQDPTSAELKQLNEKYKFGQIAGSGSEFNKSKNLLKWLSNLIKQDGESPMPAVKNADSLITFAQENKQGLKCRGLAIILNEALLSIGIKSRILELSPRDFSIDSHVITAAFISELNKWIFLDPSSNTYFLDENGIPLSPLEIRQGMISGKNLKTNADKVPGEADYYNYLAKNFYRMSSLTNSAYGSDSSSDKKYITLNPAGDNFDWYHSPFSNTLFHNPEIFWQKP